MFREPGHMCLYTHERGTISFKEGKSAINLSNLGKFGKFGPRPFIYVRPVGGPENYLC